MDGITAELLDMQDIKYKNFHAKLIPTVNPNYVIGVRTPVLRTFAKKIPDETAKKFISELPHKYYEENNLHAFLIEKINDYNECITEINRFLPYVNNWATCDMMTPKVLKKHLSVLLNEIRLWIASEHTYAIRFGIKMLMTFYLDDNFDEEYLKLVSEIKSDEYYVNMMIAWYFATALAKQYLSAVTYMENRKLDKWIHNKTIQKSVESYRIDKEKKEYLKGLKIK